MAEKSGDGGKPNGDKAGDADVLSSLSSTRPTRLSRRGRNGDEAPAKPAAKPRAKAKAAPKRKAKAKAKAAAPKAAAAPVPIAAATAKPRPRPVRAGHPELADSSGKSVSGRSEDAGQSGIALVKTVVQAAGEVAQIGATVGGQILRRAVDKLPKRP
ncbi:MAG: hypothetical protein QOE86_1211 [Solirubrobacteraceae bacterium]|nr:hypothetical protein [Solirubrobacteraceae bacterium]